MGEEEIVPKSNHLLAACKGRTVGIAARADGAVLPPRVGRPRERAPGSRGARREPYCSVCASHAVAVLCENERCGAGSPLPPSVRKVA